jgi:hypothetical protein
LVREPHSRLHTAQFIAGTQHLAFHYEFQIAAVFYEQSGVPAIRDDHSMSIPGQFRVILAPAPTGSLVLP